MATPDRDIDLVLVTGAGASHAFGTNDRPIPLMAEWCDYLVGKLAESGPAYLAVTGLEKGLDSEEFERRLGNFLKSIDSFSGVERLLKPLVALLSHRPPTGTPDEWGQWHANGLNQLDHIMMLIRQSLSEQFGSRAMDIDGAVSAFRVLLDQLGVKPATNGSTTRWVFATTNYDIIGESVLHELEYIPDVGEVTSPLGGAEAELRVDKLLGSLERSVPVLHLHGRVGWFRRDGRAYSTPTSFGTYELGAGIPIVMLPDLDKDYGEDLVIDSLWRQFEEALSRARRVLVLGHSLHDEALLGALKRRVEPHRLGVTYHAQDRNTSTPAEGAASAMTHARKELPDAAVIPIRFEPGFGSGANKQLIEWMGTIPR